MREPDDHFWGWPDRRTWGTFAWVAPVGAVWFALMYGGADFVTGLRSWRVAVDFDVEKKIPFVAAAVWVYMSIYPLFLMAPFVLRSSRRIIALGAALAVVALVAAMAFLVCPADLAYAPIGSLDPGPTARLYAFADSLNLRYNLLPSLHVALSVTCIAAYSPRAERAGKVLLWSWAGAVAASTILTHFHHVLDALTGFLLGLVAARAVYDRIALKSKEMAASRSL